MQPAGHVANGFGRWYLHEWEVRALYEAGYMAPPDFWCPDTWRLSMGGMPIPLVPQEPPSTSTTMWFSRRRSTMTPSGTPKTRTSGRCSSRSAGTKSWPITRATALHQPTGTPPGKSCVGASLPHPRLGTQPHRRGQPPTADNATTALDAA
jgi:hypothetical protein